MGKISQKTRGTITEKGIVTVTLAQTGRATDLSRPEVSLQPGPQLRLTPRDQAGGAVAGMDPLAVLPLAGEVVTGTGAKQARFPGEEAGRQFGERPLLPGNGGSQGLLMEARVEGLARGKAAEIFRHLGSGQVGSDIR
jgi:hypothetical protein